MTALKVLVSEKGQKISEGDIPNLCSCNALRENVANAKAKGAVTEDVVMCANNCQFYRDTKGYAKALRAILNCITV